jgi:transposase-like protein
MGFRAYSATMKVIGNSDRQEVGRALKNRAENSHQPSGRRERAMQRFRKLKTALSSRPRPQPFQSGATNRCCSDNAIIRTCQFVHRITECPQSS